MNKILLLTVLSLSLIIPVGVYALELDKEYFISSDSAYLIFEVDSTNKVSIIDGGIFVEDTLHEIDTSKIKVLRITNDGDYGRIFGKTIHGDNYYIIYEIDGDKSRILSKLWINGAVTRIIEDAEIDKLF